MSADTLTLSQLEQYPSKAAWILKRPIGASDDRDVENYLKVASMDDLAENDFNLNIPLYVEKIIEDYLPTVEGALVDLNTAWSESQQAEAHFKAKLKEFGVEV
jgi:type I restriction-modification system DNA methylase subunit